MQLSDLLARMGGLDTLSRELGVDRQQAASGMEALLPAILGGFKREAQARPGGMEGLGGLLGQLGGGSLLDDVLSPQPTHLDKGNDVLGQIFGSKDVSRTVAQDAAARSGLDASVLKKMLPMLAMLVAGYFARQGSTGQSQEAPGAGGLGGMLDGLLGGSSGGSSGGAAGGGGLGGLASMLDLDGNGNPLDDILRMAGKSLR